MAVSEGDWEVRVYRGFEYMPIVDKLGVKVGATTERTYQLKRWTNMPARGWYSGDDHIHARIMSDEDARLLMTCAKAVDLHVANALEFGDQFRTHCEQRGFGPSFRVQDGNYVIVPGQEDPRYWRGHAVGLNLRELARDEERYVLNDVVADWIHKQGGLYGFAHLQFQWFNVQRDMTLLVPRGKADFGEILQFSHLGTELYYDFLDLGFPLTASAGSDTPYGSGIGEVQVYAHTGEGPFTADAWFDGMKRGRTFVTNGPMVELRIDDAYPGDTVPIEPGKKVHVKVHAWGLKGASAPKLVQVVKHSEVIHEARSKDDAAQSIDIEFELDPGRGAWVAAHVFGRDGSQAHTTPVYLVREGFRFWNVDRASELIDARLATLYEMEIELAELKAQAEQNPSAATDFLWANVIKNADALRERCDLVRAIFNDLEGQLIRELGDRNE
jgi:hypothetical protein